MSLAKWAGYGILVLVVWEIFFRADWLRMKREGLDRAASELAEDNGLTAPGTVVSGPMVADLTLTQ